MNKLSKILVATALTLTAFIAQARVDKEDRVLVVVSELQEHGPQNLRQLYAATEELTFHTTNLMLGNDYRKIYYLRRSQATVANFKLMLQGLSKDISIKAIDVIFSLHGSDNRVAFYEGSVSMTTLVNQLTMVSASMRAADVAVMKRKLRMVYNLSCFGRSHNDEFIAMGFDVSVGSRGVNANSEAEFPAVLNGRRNQLRFIDTFDMTNSDAAIGAVDTVVRLGGIPADSKKFFQGRTQLTINSDPI